MTDKAKRHARALQDETGWSYTECRAQLRTVTGEGIDLMVAAVKAARASGAPYPAAELRLLRREHPRVQRAVQP